MSLWEHILPTVERRVLRSRRARVAMTVMEADVVYSTDWGLCGFLVMTIVYGHFTGGAA